MGTSPTARTRPLWLLLAGAVLCYAIGYPLALIGHSGVGWIFVGLGGSFLVVLGAMTIRHISRGTRAADSGITAPVPDPEAEPSP